MIPPIVPISVEYLCFKFFMLVQQVVPEFFYPKLAQKLCVWAYVWAVRGWRLPAPLSQRGGGMGRN